MKKYLYLLLTGIILPMTAGAQSSYKAGDIAADFKLKNVKGEMVSLAQFTDAKGFIVVFWCNTCPVVKKYEERLVKINEEFAGKGFPVIAINSNDWVVSPGDSYEEMQKKAADKGYAFQYLYDEFQDVARRYGATNTPHVYLLSKTDGKLKVEYVGAIDNNADNAAAADKHYLADAVNSLISGTPIALAGTKAIGCSLKWKKI